MTFKRIAWVRFWKPSDDPIVWIDVAKFDASWRNDACYVGPFGEPDSNPERYDRARICFLEREDVGMPHVDLADDGTAGFTDGRHRFAWLRDHGVLALPVTCGEEIEAEIRARFGTSIRATDVSLTALSMH